MADQVFDIIRQMPYHYLFTGTLLVGFLAANAKSLPLAHTLRLAPSLYRVLRAKFGSKRSKSASARQATSTTTTSYAAQPALFKHCTLQSRAIAFDLDINIHKSNSTFFADADINRAELITSLLSQALANLGSPAFILAGVQCKFQREIRPYQSYVVSSRILAWSDKAMYVVTYFTKPGTKLARELDLLGGPEALAKDSQVRKILFGTMVSKYVFKAGRATVAPEHVFQEAGLLIEADSKDGVSGGNELISREDVAASVQAGLRYITRCMD
ncbi:4HBT-2 domain containing protein [Pyrenophora tritici-repentis]|nr:4HBT-2 domain containing protein [Pyrenophora tritici-repentis]